MNSLIGPEARELKEWKGKDNDGVEGVDGEEKKRLMERYRKTWMEIFRGTLLEIHLWC